MNILWVKSLKLPKKKKVQMPASLLKRLLAIIVDFIIINLIILTPFRNKLMPKDELQTRPQIVFPGAA